MDEDLKNLAEKAKAFFEKCGEPDDGSDYYSDWSEGSLRPYFELMLALNKHFGTDYKLSKYGAEKLGIKQDGK